MNRPPLPRTAWIAAALALALLAGAYSDSFGNAFHFDDSHVLLDNAYVRSLSNVPRFFVDASTFSAEPRNATYRPLVTLSLALDHAVAGGLNPPVYHATQLLLLAFLAALSWAFFARLLGPDRWGPALFAAAWFALHVTATETMNLMHARSEILSAAGVVGSFLAWIGAPALRRWGLYLLPMALGALAKDPAVVFAPLLAVYVWLFEEGQPFQALFTRAGRPALRRTALRVLPAFVVGTAVFLGVEAMNAPGATYGGGTRLEYLRTQMFVWLHYARLFLAPVGLTADTDWRLIPQWYDTRVLAGVAFVGLLARWAWVASRDRELRPVAFGIAWFVLGLLPASSVFPLAEVSNEHRVFLPYVGAVVAVTAAGAAWLRGRGTSWHRAAAALAVAVLLGNAAGTWVRNGAWRTGETLWKDVTIKSPLNGRGWMNYGRELMAQGRFGEAKEALERAKALAPGYATVEVNLGVVAGRVGTPAEAESHFRAALALSPEDTAARVFFGRWLLEQDRAPEAIPFLEQAVSASPANLMARHQLMEAFGKAGRPDAQSRVARETLAIAPDDDDARRIVDAAAPAATAASAPPPPADAHAIALEASRRAYERRDYPRCVLEARRAANLRPDSAEAWNNVAAGFASLRRWDDAITAAHRALELKPDFPLARNNLAWAEREKARQTAGSRTGP